MSNDYKVGNIVIIDGMPGGGSTTQFCHLETLYPRALYATEPLIRPYKKGIENLMLNPASAVTGEKLHQFDHIWKVIEKYSEKTIQAAVLCEKNVISDGFDASILAYHIHGTGSQDHENLFTDRRKNMFQHIIGEYVHVHYFLLLLDPEESLRRVAVKNGIEYQFDKKKLIFMENIAEGYRKFAALYPKDVSLIDTTGRSIKHVRRELREDASIFLGKSYNVPPGYDNED